MPSNFGSFLTFPTPPNTLALNFWSSLYEGKGTEDESWGLDNVRVSINSDAPIRCVGLPGVATDITN